MGSPRSEAGIEDQAFAPTIEALTAPTGRPEPVSGLKTNEALARWISRWAQQLQACNADKSALAMLLMERTMPAGFEKCAQNGGRVRRISGPNKEHGLSEGEYVDYCYKDGESYRGEVKTKDGASDKEGGDPSPPTSSRSSGMKPGKGPGGGMPMPPS